MNTYQIIGDGFGGMVDPIKADYYEVEGLNAHFYLNGERVASANRWIAIVRYEAEGAKDRAFLAGVTR